MNIKEKILKAYLNSDIKEYVYEKLIAAEDQNEINKVVEAIFNSEPLLIPRPGSYELRQILNFHSEMPLPGKYIHLSMGFDSTKRFDFDNLITLKKISDLFKAGDWVTINWFISSEKFLPIKQYANMTMYFREITWKYYAARILQIPFDQFSDYVEGNKILLNNPYVEAMNKLKTDREVIINECTKMVKLLTDENLNMTSEKILSLKWLLANTKSFISLLNQFILHISHDNKTDVNLIFTEYAIYIVSAFISEHKAIPEYMYEDYFKKFNL